MRDAEVADEVIKYIISVSYFKVNDQFKKVFTFQNFMLVIYAYKTNFQDVPSVIEHHQWFITYCSDRLDDLIDDIDRGPPIISAGRISDPELGIERVLLLAQRYVSTVEVHCSHTHSLTQAYTHYINCFLSWSCSVFWLG